ncbi:hypothetical protein Tco_1012393 [Tanacetum coccineum]
MKSIKEILLRNHDNSIEPILDHLPEDCNNPDLFAANSIDEEIPTPKLKELPSHLEYAFLDNNRKLPVIVSSLLSERIEDGFSGYFQIRLAPEDQEKTTFTCPYGTFAYRRMPFGLCNAPATFQQCMMEIFHDMCKDFICEEMNLVLNWEKCHFMVKEGIVLGHKISKAGIEVDKDKVDVIASLPYPTNVKNIMDEVDIEDLTIEHKSTPIQELAHYFGPNQPDAESDCNSEDIEEEVEYMIDDEVVMSEQEESNLGYTQNI